ncbi:MAG TPA: serine hydrolase domain-containing protein [Hyphomicrobiaceae bacterium]|jgi:CubicO group peptidase (beta-lactamase class C family)|nr:serine hydrolase domain-containing protein [Hyphomicrobiaceae bacterium]
MTRPAFIAVALALAATSAVAQPLPKAASPEEVGLSSQRLERIGTALKEQIDKGQMPGAVVAIARKGKLAYFEAFGYRDKASNAPMTTDAIFSIASMTKPLTSVAIMMLYEEGRLFIADPVGKYLPQLANMKVGVVKTDANGKTVVETVAANRQITIQDLLRHTSGLVYGGRGTTEIHKQYPASSAQSALTLTPAEFLDKLGRAPLYHQPASTWDYSLSVDVLGLVVEAVSGKKLGEFLAERVFAPLGMVDSGFEVPASKQSRYALALDADPLTGKQQFVLHASGKPLKFDCGGGCGVSTAGDYLRFAQMLLRRGELDGKRLLAPKTVDYMTSNHLAPDVLARTTSTVLPTGYGFGLGFAVRLETGMSNLTGSKGDYNWGGAYGTYFWVDPQEDLVVVYMAHTPGDARIYGRNLIKSLVLQAIVD